MGSTSFFFLVVSVSVRFAEGSRSMSYYFPVLDALLIGASVTIN